MTLSNSSSAAPAADSSQPQSNGNHHISEDEAALYDRQIRLWGIEAQNRMRSANVLLINFRGLSAEVAKNLVLAGIDKLVIWDDKKCHEEDLSTNFFLREEDVSTSKYRVEAVKDRIQLLNPRVTIETNTSAIGLNDPNLASYLSQFTLVCLTESHPEQIAKLNHITRQNNTKFHVASSLGQHGYIFTDQGSHEYVVEAEEIVKAEDGVETEKRKTQKKIVQNYTPFTLDLIQQDFTLSMSKRNRRKLDPLAYFVFVLWEFQKRNHGNLPDPETDPSHLVQMQSIAKDLIPELAKILLLDQESSTTVNFLKTLAQTAVADFTPTCAILGGVLAQDILNVISAREEPIANLFVYNGESSSGDIYALGIDKN